MFINIINLRQHMNIFLYSKISYQVINNDFESIVIKEERRIIHDKFSEQLTKIRGKIN